MLLVLLVSLFTFGQIDVTQYYLENAGFDGNYDYIASQTNAVGQEIKPIDGWTAGHNLNYTIAGVYQLGFQGTYNKAKVPSKGYDNETTGGGLALSTGWGNDFPYYQIVTLPKGIYTISVPTYNGKNVAAGTSLLAWIPNSGDAVKSTVAEYPVEKWVLDKITFTLDEPTTGKIQIGYKAAAGGSVNSCNIFIDYVKIEGENMVLNKADLKTLIDAANALYDDGTGVGASDFKKMIEEAQTVYEKTDASVIDQLDIEKKLRDASIVYTWTNFPEGTATDVWVTETNHYVPTGATEALIRATVEGDDILESGVCWSTNHNPTVLDNKSTNKHSYNGDVYHPKGLTPSTVYYFRPYVMNKSYEVAYGDEVKVVTHPKGNCTWSWNEGAPTAEANDRCRNAIKGTIDYFNEWTGIMGFKLTGTYGSGTPTADCSYGGSMRIGPNASYQAIGTVLHETGHGVGVGTHWRWYNCADTRANTTSGKWLGREANDMLRFLENKKPTDDIYWNGDRTHGWAHGGTMDWLVNGADKDKHSEYQYVGGCLMLWAMFIDGICPTTAYPNGISGYTYNFDDRKKYYLMPKDAKGLGKGLLGIQSDNQLGWKPILDTGSTIDDNFAWYLEYEAENCYYHFRNAKTGQYMSHNNNASVTMKSFTGSNKPAKNEFFQLMPDRTDVTLGVGKYRKTTHGYWVTWRTNQSMKAEDINASKGYGAVPQQSFNYSNAATQQQWIIISEDELKDYLATAAHPDYELVLDEDFTNLDYISKDNEKKYSNSKLYLHRTFHKDKWNTIVLPVDLTAAQFKKAFGEEAKLAKFVGVKNDRLQFSVLDATGDGAFMEANTPYIIKPTVLATNEEAYSFKVTYEDNTSEVVSVNTPYYIIEGVSLDKSHVADKVVTSDVKDDYTFKGIFVQDYSENPSSFIDGAHCLAGDYTFNVGTLHCFKNNYGMKGFRAWFHPENISFSAKKLGVEIDGVSAGDVTGIDLILNDSTDGSDEIYNLNGQRITVQDVKLLPSGVYIVNSKKVIVK